MASATQDLRWITIDTMVGGLAVSLETRAGFASWGHVTPAQNLLATYGEVDPDERVLVGPCGHGALGVWAAVQSESSQVTVYDTHVVATQAARRTLDANGCTDACVETSPPLAAQGPYDVALMTLPKGRHLARLWLLACFRALKPGGRLYIAGANRAGIKSALKDCDALYGKGQVLAFKGGNRVALYDRGMAEPEPLPKGYGLPGVVEGSYHTYGLEREDAMLTLHTRPGVFSWQKLDFGSAMLLDYLKIVPDDVVLDVGCGCGVLGLVAARVAEQGHVTMVDVDALAYECAALNVKRNGVTNARVVLGEGLADIADGSSEFSNESFSLILSNPPFHSGHEIDLEMARRLIQDAWQALTRSGRLVIVANRFLPYNDLMRERFGQVTVLHHTSQYHVLQAIKRRHVSKRDGASR